MQRVANNVLPSMAGVLLSGLGVAGAVVGEAGAEVAGIEVGAAVSVNVAFGAGVTVLAADEQLTSAIAATVTIKEKTKIFFIILLKG